LQERHQLLAALKLQVLQALSMHLIAMQQRTRRQSQVLLLEEWRSSSRLVKHRSRKQQQAKCSLVSLHRHLSRQTPLHSMRQMLQWLGRHHRLGG
jgi:hypothetical protein